MKRKSINKSNNRNKMFYVIFADDEKKEYDVSDLICDDRLIIKKTAQLQKSGKKVHISTGCTDIKKAFIKGYKFNPDLKIQFLF